MNNRNDARGKNERLVTNGYAPTKSKLEERGYRPATPAKPPAPPPPPPSSGSNVSKPASSEK